MDFRCEETHVFKVINVTDTRGIYCALEGYQCILNTQPGLSRRKSAQRLPGHAEVSGEVGLGHTLDQCRRGLQ